MNSSSTNQPHITINTFKQSKTKKKSLPISINSNIAPGSFLFNNKVSKVATSYKNIGDQINTYEKLKQLNQKGKAQSNVFMLNNFFSVNSLSSKNSQMSNNSILNKNTSNIMSSRINPSKNTSNILFSKNNLINNLTGYTTCTSNRNAKYKTISKDKYNDINNPNTQRNMKLKAVKQIRRQKSIVSLVPSSKGNKMISFKNSYHTNTIMNVGDNQRMRNYNMSMILNNNYTNDKASPNNSQNIYVNVNSNINKTNKAFNTIRSEGNSVRNKSERSTVKNCVVTKANKNRSVSLKHNKHNNTNNNKKSFRKTIHTETLDDNNTKSDRQYEKAFNILSVPSQSCKNKNISTINKNGNVLTTYSSFNTSNTIGNLNNNNINHIKTIKVETGSRKRRLSHGSISLTKETQLNQNEIVSHHRNNNSISINRLALNKFIINNNNEKKQQQQNNNNNIQHNINSNEAGVNNNNDDVQTKQQIKINLNPLFQDIKVSSTSRPKQNIPLEKVQVNRKQKSQSKNNKNTQNKPSSQKQEQLYRNNNQDNINNIIYETNKLSLIDNNNTNNNNILCRNLFENENIIYDDPPLKDDPFDNLNDVVRRLNFKSINTAQANIFSIDNNFKYKSYQSYFDIEFDKKVKSKHSLTTTNITSAHKALSTGNKSSERKSFHNVSMSTQDNSNKKYVSSPIHRISYCN